MKYFIDTEFLEGTQKERFPVSLFRKESKPTIDLISIGIVAEDGREYYAISKDFNLKEAWNRYDIKDGVIKPKYTWDSKIKESEKVYWIRENVLLPIYKECVSGDARNRIPFTYSGMKYVLSIYGKTNKQIAEEVKEFCITGSVVSNKGLNVRYYKEYTEAIDTWIKGEKIENNNPIHYNNKPEFYGYYADYDWVAFCWLFGKMMDLPKGFPYLAYDIQQLIIEQGIDKNQLLKEVPQINNHNALQDALWNKDAYIWIKQLENEENND